MTLLAVTLLAGCRHSTPNQSGLIADLRFTSATLGEYSATSTLDIPAPWARGDLEGDGSQAVVYDAATARAGWPAPFSWSPRALAMTSVADGHTDRARVQIQSKPLSMGTDCYIGMALWIPSAAAQALPEFNGNLGTYLAAAQLFGAPFTRSAPVSVMIRKDGGRLLLVAANPAADSPRDVLWQTPIATDRWITVVLHVVISTHPVAGNSQPGGELEVWVDGTKQHFVDLPSTTDPNYDRTGQTLSTDGMTAHIATANLDTSAGVQFYLDNYRSAINPSFTVPKSITIFQAGAKIARDYAGAAS